MGCSGWNPEYARQASYLLNHISPEQSLSMCQAQVEFSFFLFKSSQNVVKKANYSQVYD